MARRRSGFLAGFFFLLSGVCLAGREAPRKDFGGDTSPGGRYTLEVAAPPTPSPGATHALLLRDKVTGAQRELLRFRVHVDVGWSRDGEQLAVSDYGDGHRGNAFLFDLKQSSEPIDLGRRLLAERPETSRLFQQKDVFVQAQGWSADLGWTIRLHGQGPDEPRGFQRWYHFDLRKGFYEGGGGPKSLGKGEKDYDAPEFDGWTKVLLDRAYRSETRVNAMREVMMRDARRGLALLAGLLADTDQAVRDRAAEWLAIRGDRRGLDRVRTWLNDIGRADEAARRLGNAGRKEYAAPIAAQVRRILGSKPAGPLWGGAERAVLREGTFALARLGRPEDRELIFEVAGADLGFRFSGLSALGYVDDPRSRTLLWKWHAQLTRDAEKVETGGAQSEALLALSRLGDRTAIESFKRILREREGWWLPNHPPQLFQSGETAFRSLRPRDASLFAETVFEVAAEDPEGPGTREAWEALGVMRPDGFGERVLKLAHSRRPHWKTVSRSLLNDVIIAIDPELNSAF